MGLPKMPAEYELPNLCGANAGLGDVQKKIDEGIKNLTDRIEFSASDIKAKLDVDVADFKDKLSKLKMPTLPSLPDVSLQSEMTSIANIDTSTLVGRLQKVAKTLQTKNLFGDALKSKGIDFDSTLKDVEASIVSGGDACAACKNFMVKQGGKSTDVAEKPANTMTADFQSQKEEVSTVSTPATAEGVGLKNIFGFMSGSTPILGDTLGKAMKIVGEGGPNMNTKLEELNQETEAKIKTQMEANGIPIHPGIVKNENELNQNKSLFTVDKAKVDANPIARTDSKESAFKAESGAQKTLQETTNIELLYNKLMDDFKLALNESEKKWQRLNNFKERCIKKYPDNIAPNGKGDTVLTRSANLEAFEKLFLQIRDFDKQLTEDIKGEVDQVDSDVRNQNQFSNNAEYILGIRNIWETKFAAAITAAGDVGKEIDEVFKSTFVDGKIFEIATPAEGEPGGPIPSPYTAMKQQIEALIIGQGKDGFKIVKVLYVKTHASGLTVAAFENENGQSYRVIGPSIFNRHTRMVGRRGRKKKDPVTSIVSTALKHKFAGSPPPHDQQGFNFKS